jgi:hypothetical protein
MPIATVRRGVVASDIVLAVENDVLRRLRDVGRRRRERERYYPGVLVLPEEADGRLRVVVDHMVPTTSGSRSPPAAPLRLKLPLPRNE